MKLKKIPWMAVLLLLGGTACNKENGLSATDNRIPLEITAGYPVQTRATDAGFADGDRIGIYVTDYTGNAAKPLEEARVPICRSPSMKEPMPGKAHSPSTIRTPPPPPT